MILHNNTRFSTMKLVSREKREISFHVYSSQFHLFYRLESRTYSDGIPFGVSHILKVYKINGT